MGISSQSIPHCLLLCIPYNQTRQLWPRRHLSVERPPCLTCHTTTVRLSRLSTARSWSSTTPSTTTPTSPTTTPLRKRCRRPSPRTTLRLRSPRSPPSTSTAEVTSTTLFSGRTWPPRARAAVSPQAALWPRASTHTSAAYAMKEKFNAALAGIQGSGWAWLVQDNHTGALQIRTYANQDPVVGQFHPILGIDAWEHAYYLQYENRKAEYFKAIWDVINWKAADKRFK